VVFPTEDVTIRPDSWHRGIARMITGDETPEGEGRRKQHAHIFVRDTWVGMECVNSGFVAFRDTEVSRLFLKLWPSRI
jgi:hypothetical protein